MNYKDFFPPIIFKFINKIKNKETDKIIYDKEYENYFVAQENCVSGAYQNIELCDMIALKTKVLKDNISINPLNKINNINIVLLSAINHTIIANSLNSITVLDFGGACGAHYFEIRKYLPSNIKLNWLIIETEQMVISAKNANLENDELKFFSSLIDLPKIDFIYTSGTLQYTSDPYKTLKELLSLNSYYILFNRMMFNENNKDFITVQNSALSDNGPGTMPTNFTNKTISYPHTTLSYNKFKTTALESHELIWEFEELSGIINILTPEKIIGRGLLFKNSKYNKMNE